MYLPSGFVTWPTAIILLNVCFHCTIHANFGTRDDNVTASQLFPPLFCYNYGSLLSSLLLKESLVLHDY